MYCAACGKEILSETKFCPQCGKAINGSSQQPKRTHPTLATFLIALLTFGLHAFLLGGIGPGKDTKGINAIFTIIYIILFFVFLVTLFRKPKETTSTTTKNVLPRDLKGQEKNHSNIWKWIIAIILILVLPSFFIYAKGSWANPAVNTTFVIIILAILAGFIWYFINKHREGSLKIFHEAVKTIKFLVHHPKLAASLSVICLVLIILARFGLAQWNYQRSAKALPLIQDSLAETAAVKLMGDSIMAGKSTPSGIWMAKIGTTTKTVSENLTRLSVPGILTDYNKSAISWSSTIADAADNTNIWKNLPEQPGNFRINLSDSKATEYIEASLAEIVTLKEAGDMAIKRHDRQTMYYIAAKLLVQKHWLNSVIHSNNAGLLGLKNPVQTALAFTVGPTGRKMTWQCNLRRGSSCTAETVNSINKVLKPAVEYSEANSGAEANWNNAWNEATPLKPDISGGQTTEGGKGVSQGEDATKIQYSPTEQAFFDECHAKGGIVGGTGGVKARMPTTQSGYNCDYKNGQNSCWDSLTYSGGRYMGGNPGCPEQNLLPPPPPAPEAPKPTQAPVENPQPTRNPQPTQKPNTSSWDGTYSGSNSKFTCDNSQFGNISSFTALPNIVVVQNNTINLPFVGNLRVDANGYAHGEGSLDLGQGLRENISITYNFSRAGGRVSVSGKEVYSIPMNYQGKNVGVHCSSTFVTN